MESARWITIMLLVAALLLAGCESASETNTGNSIESTDRPIVTAIQSSRIGEATQGPRSTATPTTSNVPPVVVPANTSVVTVPSQPTVALTETVANDVPTATQPPTTPPGDEGQVVNVVDGDTIDVVVNGTEHRIRIIGVDTPETKDPNSPVMCYGAEATAFTQELINRANGRVFLEKDISETDRYDRVLRYVWLAHPDGNRMLNYELVAQGYAQVSTYPPDVKYTDMFLEAQQAARDENRGLWGECGGFGIPVATPEPTPAPVAPQPTAPSSGNCDPSYPGVCIPPYSQVGDLDCGDISYRRFTVLQPDPHGFDADYDGVGCESG